MVIILECASVHVDRAVELDRNRYKYNGYHSGMFKCTRRAVELDRNRFFNLLFQISERMKFYGPI